MGEWFGVEAFKAARVLGLWCEAAAGFPALSSSLQRPFYRSYKNSLYRDDVLNLGTIQSEL